MTKRNIDSFRYDLIHRGCAVLCALSGGADSMDLLCRLLDGAAAGGYTVKAAHYNHHLRPTAGQDEKFVRTWCESHAVPLTVGGGDVAAAAAERRQGAEETARDMRYAFLDQVAKETGCSLIATGHHADDNAETVLMNLIRGCGSAGLGGIPERRGNLIRPMLGLTRQEIEADLARRGVPHVEDESNADQSYTRNRVRHRLMPLLEELNPQAVAHINQTARLARADDRALCRQAEGLLGACTETEDGVSIPLSLLTEAPSPVVARALRRLIPGAGSVHLKAIARLCEGEAPSAVLTLPGVTVRRVYDSLLIGGDDPPAPQPAPLREGMQTWGAWQILCAPAVCPPKAYVSPGEFYLKSASYRIRSRQSGDALQLGDRPNKTIKELMIEARIPRHLRGLIPVLVDGENAPAAAGGLGPHRSALAQPGTDCLRIILRKGETTCIRM